MDQQTIENFTPLSDRILVSLEEEETGTNLHIPEGVSAQEGNGQVGTVVAVGDDPAVENGTSLTDIQIGDRVLFQENVGRDLPGDDGEHRLVRQSNLLAVLGG